MPITGGGGGIISYVAGAGPMTWTLTGSTNMLLSNGNLTMEGDTGASNNCVVSNRAITPGALVYMEFILVTRAFSPYIGFATFDENRNQRPGQTVSPTLSWGIGLNTGLYQEGGSTDDSVAVIPSGTSDGTRIGIAYNQTVGRVWATLDGITWNPNIALGVGQNPVGNLLGVSDITTNTLIYVIASASVAGDKITMVPEAPFGFTKPVGYSAP